jgi:hypothetical protein
VSTEVARVDLKRDNKITIHFAERWGADGPIQRRWQVTVNRRQFETIMRNATITVPWNEVSP